MMALRGLLWSQSGERQGLTSQEAILQRGLDKDDGNLGLRMQMVRIAGGRSKGIDHPKQASQPDGVIRCHGYHGPDTTEIVKNERRLLCFINSAFLPPCACILRLWWMPNLSET